MATIPVTPSVVQDIVDNADERELWIVGREFERPPYFHAGKGGDTRLTRALRLCIDEKITPNSDGSYQVEGSAGRSYRVGDSCSCPNSQKASTSGVITRLGWRCTSSGNAVCAPWPPWPSGPCVRAPCHCESTYDRGRTAPPETQAS